MNETAAYRVLKLTRLSPCLLRGRSQLSPGKCHTNTHFYLNRAKHALGRCQLFVPAS